MILRWQVWFAFLETMVHPRPSQAFGSNPKKHMENVMWFTADSLWDMASWVSSPWESSARRILYPGRSRRRWRFGSGWADQNAKPFHPLRQLNMEVSTNGIPPKWMVYSGKTFKKHSLWKWLITGGPPIAGILHRFTYHILLSFLVKRQTFGDRCRFERPHSQTSQLVPGLQGWDVHGLWAFSILIGLVFSGRGNTSFLPFKNWIIGMSSSLPSLTIPEWGCQGMPINNQGLFQGAVLVAPSLGKKKRQPFWN